jgi:hypothetical protein
MINDNYFISIVIKNEELSSKVYQFVSSEYDFPIKVFKSIDELNYSYLNSLGLIITDLELNKFFDFIGVKIIKFNEEIDDLFINNLNSEIECSVSVRENFKLFLKENKLEFEIDSKNINLEKMDSFIFYLLNKFLVDMSFDFKYSIGIILKESITNAFYHGNFNIDSSIKEEEEGFLKFYNLVAQKQNDTRYNSKKVYLTLSLTLNKLIISVEDEGNGFKYKKLVIDDNKNYGRGIKLIIANSNNVSWNDKGNKIIIEKNING